MPAGASILIPPPRRWAATLLAAGWALWAICSSSEASDRLLHSFDDSLDDGAGPYGSLTLSGSALYGLTASGGNGQGTIFKLNADGTGYSVLRQLGAGAAAATDGGSPYGSLTLANATLYGLTSIGGTGGGGTVFSLALDGAGFRILHSFTGDVTDGALPRLSSLTASGTKLFGTTGGGGAQGTGAIFSLNTNGTGFSLLHSFMGGTGDGASSLGSLALVGTKLYGMTQSGGTYDEGTLFSLNQDGSGFSLLHSFHAVAGDGALPSGSLTLLGTKLYGMSYGGGSQNRGTIFSINPDGSSFGVLHNFTDTPGDGSYPSGSLTVSGTKLYGLTEQGGATGMGALFGMNADGSAFQILHGFAGGAADGRLPSGDVTFSADGQTLYGMTYGGGGLDDGVVFSAPVPEPSTGLALLTGLALCAGFRRGRRVAEFAPVHGAKD